MGRAMTLWAELPHWPGREGFNCGQRKVIATAVWSDTAIGQSQSNPHRWSALLQRYRELQGTTVFSVKLVMLLKLNPKPDLFNIWDISLVLPSKSCASSGLCWTLQAGCPPFFLLLVRFSLLEFHPLPPSLSFRPQ